MADGSKPTVSFGFSKKTEASKLRESKLKDDFSKETAEEKDIIVSVEGNEITGTKKKIEKKELVIPMINGKKWGVPETPDKPTNGNEANDAPVELTLEQLAAKEILEESQNVTENWENRGKSKNASVEIPLFMQNKVAPVEEAVIESTIDDYEDIPVEEYGMAMLRGMGFKANEGIGLKNKGVTAPLQVAARPKGLGLGAAVPKAEKIVLKSQNGKEEILEIKKGSYVHVTSGKQQGLYGQIEGFNENTGRVSVKMAVGGQVLDISELCLKPVTLKEYKDSSRVLNKEKYDEYKSKQEEKEKNEKEEKRHRKKDRKHRSRSRSRSRSHSKSRQRSGSRDRSEKEKKRTSEKKSEKKHEKESHKSKKESTAWLHANLRVRCVDEKFKKGKYFKHKMIVIDVVSQTHCSCQTEDGTFLDGVEISMLETVIPRDDPAYVMVVSGKRKGQICQVIERDRKRYVATVQTLPDRDEIFEISYDDVCEFTGEV